MWKEENDKGENITTELDEQKKQIMADKYPLAYNEIKSDATEPSAENPDKDDTSAPVKSTDNYELYNEDEELSFEQEED